jgi:hypothetical protein
MRGRRLGVLWFGVLRLRIKSTASHRAAALLTSNHPGVGQC